MRVGVQTLPDHLPNPFTGKYSETQAERYALLIEMGVQAEKAGFWGYWIGEHHAYYMFVPSPPVLLAAVAAKTTKIKVGSGITLLPNCDPVRTAEDFAELDLISNGRAVMGLGSGITPSTFALFAQNPEESNDLSREKLDMILRLWSEREVTAPAGKHVQALDRVTLEPRTFHDKPIPIFRACARDETAIDAGRRGQKLSVLTVVRDFAMNKRFADIYREEYLKAGHDPKHMSVGVNIMTACFHKDGEKNRERWHKYVDNYHEHAMKHAMIEMERFPSAKKAGATPPPGMAKVGEFHSSHIAGTADQILEMLAQRYKDIGGFDELNCIFDNGGNPGNEVLESIHCFGETVIPKLGQIDGKIVNQEWGVDPMPVRQLEHYNILTPRLAETVAFYGDVLGMRAEASPGSGDIRESAWIYDQTGTAVVHLQSVDPADPEKRFARVRERLGNLIEALDIGRLKGGGAIEHVAFQCDDFEGLAADLKRKGVPFRENHVAAMNLRQIFLNDPNGVTLELNFR